MKRSVQEIIISLIFVILLSAFIVLAMPKASLLRIGLSVVLLSNAIYAAIWANDIQKRLK